MTEIRANKIALGCPTNDFFNFLDILYPPNFGCLGGNWSFSTATGVSTQNPINERYRDITTAIYCARLVPAPKAVKVRSLLRIRRTNCEKETGF